MNGASNNIDCHLVDEFGCSLNYKWVELLRYYDTLTGTGVMQQRDIVVEGGDMLVEL